MIDPNQFDPNIKQPTSPMKLIAMTAVVLVVGAGCFFFGKSLAEISFERDAVNRRIGLADSMLQTVEPKVEAYAAFIKPFIEKANAASDPTAPASYDDALFKQLESYSSVDFALDPSTDIPAESIILAQKQDANPLAELRQYSTGTMILLQMISNHVAETKADMAEIKDVLGGETSGESRLYAVEFSPTELGDFLALPLRTDEQFNFGTKAKSLMRVKRALTSPEELEAKWKEIQPEDWEAPAEGPDLPPKLIYEVQPRGGAVRYLTANEILLLPEDQVLGSRSNAAERYKKRMIQILKIMKQVDEAGGPLLDKLKKQAEEEKL